jgi:hypothetical protein
MTPLDKLRALAEAATPGPWATKAPRNLPRGVIAAGSMQVADAFNDTHWTDEQCERNAAFIAAANPQTVLKLLDERDALRAPEAHWECQQRVDALEQQLSTLTAQRDQALAKVESLYKSIESSEAHQTAARLFDKLATVATQRDQALAAKDEALRLLDSHTWRCKADAFRAADIGAVLRKAGR